MTPLRLLTSDLFHAFALDSFRSIPRYLLDRLKAILQRNGGLNHPIQELSLLGKVTEVTGSIILSITLSKIVRIAPNTLGEWEEAIPFPHDLFQGLTTPTAAYTLVTASTKAREAATIFVLATKNIPTRERVRLILDGTLSTLATTGLLVAYRRFSPSIEPPLYFGKRENEWGGALLHISALITRNLTQGVLSFITLYSVWRCRHRLSKQFPTILFTVAIQDLLPHHILAAIGNQSMGTVREEGIVYGRALLILPLVITIIWHLIHLARSEERQQSWRTLAGDFETIESNLDLAVKRWVVAAAADSIDLIGEGVNDGMVKALANDRLFGRYIDRSPALLLNIEECHYTFMDAANSILSTAANTNKCGPMRKSLRTIALIVHSDKRSDCTFPASQLTYLITTLLSRIKIECGSSL